MKRPIIYKVMALCLLVVSCGKDPADAGAGSEELEPGASGGAAAAYFDSLREHSVFSRDVFATLRRNDSIHWRLVADLMSYYYSVLWTEDGQGLRGPQIDSRLVDRRLRISPEWWSEPSDVSPAAAYDSLLRQVDLLADFPVSQPDEENLRLGLKRFLHLYLDSRYTRLLREFPMRSSLQSTFAAEHAAWSDHLVAEAAFCKALYRDSVPSAAQDPGIRIGALYDSRRRRRAAADRETYFALAAAGYAPEYVRYVTWAETQAQYETLRSRLLRAGAQDAAAALDRESAAWFRYMKVRSSAEELLGESPAGRAYAGTTRAIKMDHLTDLRKW